MKKEFLLLGFLFVIMPLSGCVQQDIQSEQGNNTEIRVPSWNTEMVISPSNGNVINGVVTIRFTRVPEGTKTVGFVIQGPGIEDIKNTGPNIGIDTYGGDGWSIRFDTGAYPDGIYTIAGFTASVELGEEGEPTGMAQVQIEIKNEGVEEMLEPPAEIEFYKGVQVWVTVTDKEIAEVKNMDANVIRLMTFAEYENGKIVLSEDWDIYLKGRIREAYRNGLAVSVSVGFPADIDKKFPYREGSDIDLPPGYDVTPFIDNMKEIYREIAIFAEENKVHSIIIHLEIEAWIGRVFENSREYWEKSSKINREVTSEIRKYFNGRVVGAVMGGQWGFDAPCCYTNVPVDAIDISVFDAIDMPTNSDYRITGSPLGYIEEGLKRIEFTRDIMNRNDVKILYVGVGGFPLISPWEGDRVALYSEFFEKTQGKTDGYSVTLFPETPEPIYDTEGVDAAEIWYKKI